MELTQIKGCILVPTYNNQNTLKRVLDGVLKCSHKDDVIVVNDGSTDGTVKILDEYKDKIIVLTNPENKGKGFSIRKGFKEAIARGFENIITIDSDGQHYPEDITKFISVANENPGALIMGSRNMNQDAVPGKSSFGNKFSNFWFWVETGIKLPDTQTGFRLYPLKPLQEIKLYTVKFELEIEVIVKLAWKNVNIIPIEINVLYDPSERVSHFRPFRDFTRISILNTFLVIQTLFYYLPKRLILKIYKKGFWASLRDVILNPEESNFKKASSIGFGFFMGIVPIWGFQLLIGIPLSILFRMNKVLFIAAANISVPPLIPAIIVLSYYVGSFFVENKVYIENIKSVTLETTHVNVMQYVVGAIVLAVASGLITFVISYLLFSLRKSKTQK